MLILSINSSPPSAAYMRQRIGSALVQIMACHLFCAKPLSKPRAIVNWTIRNKLQWNFDHNRKLFIHASENVICEMAVILSWPQCVNTLIMPCIYVIERVITGSSKVYQVVSAKPLPEPMITYFRLYLQKLQWNVKQDIINKLHQRKSGWLSWGFLVDHIM